MGQFKPMVKMMTTEPSVELKLKKGGAVAKPKKMMDGGVMGALSAAPAPVGVRGGMAPAARPARPPMAARRRAMAGRKMPAMPAMAEGGDTKLEKHAAMPASKAHKGLKTGGVVMGQGGYKAGGIIKSTKGKTMMHTAEGGSSTPKKTGDVKMGNSGGYAKGGGVEGNVSSTPAGKTGTSTGEVKKGNAGGYMKGGAAKKAYATGGLVDSGHPVAYPKKPKSEPVSNNRQSGTFKKGGNVKMAGGGSSAEKLEDLSKGAYDKSIGPSEDEMGVAKEIRAIPRNILEKIKRASDVVADKFYMGKPKAGSVTETEKSVTVTPAKKRGGSVKC